MQKPFHIVLTTIFEPRVLYEYRDNIERHDHTSIVKIWLVGDVRTPASCRMVANDLSSKGLETVFLDIDTQDRWGRSVCPTLYKRVPLNSETRRNIGYLKALEEGCEVLISIDDDNYPPVESFIEGHSVTGKPWEGALTSDPVGFLNLCEYLELSPARQVFPRGFPLNLRDMKNQPSQTSPGSSIMIGAKAGLWTGAPDIDAVTWINGAVESVSYQGEPTHVLGHDTWVPISTQNLSVCRALVPACLCVPMGWKVPGGRLERYGDVWGGYFMQAVMRGTAYHAAFGTPITEHRRNPHDPLDDLRKEFWGMLLTDRLVGLLKNRFTPCASSITERTLELSEFLKENAHEALPDWCPKEMREFLALTAENLSLWAQACSLFL